MGLSENVWSLFYVNGSVDKIRAASDPWTELAPRDSDLSTRCTCTISFVPHGSSHLPETRKVPLFVISLNFASLL